MNIDLSSVEKFLKSGKSQGFTDVNKVSIVETSPACGDETNFVCQVLRLRLSVQFKTGLTQQINVIIKKEPNSEQFLYNLYNNLKLFNIEIEIYEMVLSKMDFLLKEIQECNESNLWPNYYGHSDKEILLEDLSISNFFPYPKGKALKVNEALTVMKDLGKFHGLSLSLVQRKLYDPSSLPPNLFVHSDEALRSIEKTACNNLADAVGDWEPQWKCYADKLRQFGEEIGKKSNKLWYETKGKLDVINHGDCWINNIMFKHNTDGTGLLEIKFVDYQGSHYNSYAWDLQCFLFSALIPRERDENLDRLLLGYLDGLTKYSKKTGYVGPLPSMEELKDELDRLSPCALIRAIISNSYFLNYDHMSNDSSQDDGTDRSPSNINKSEFVKENLKHTLSYFKNKNCF